MVQYLNNKLESASDIGVVADNNDNVDITDPHVKERGRERERGEHEIEGIKEV